MSTLTEFLNARIAEDEAAARKCLDVNQLAAMLNGAAPRRWITDGANVRDDAERPIDQTIRVAHTWVREADHIVRWDPARVVAECKAKREIVGTHSPFRVRTRNDGMNWDYSGCGECQEPEGWEPRDGSWWPCATLRTLAVVYADHPDYRQEWAL